MSVSMCVGWWGGRVQEVAGGGGASGCFYLTQHFPIKR